MREFGVHKLETGRSAGRVFKKQGEYRSCGRTVYSSSIYICAMLGYMSTPNCHTPVSNRRLRHATGRLSFFHLHIHTAFPSPVTTENVSGTSLHPITAKSETTSSMSPLLNHPDTSRLQETRLPKLRRAHAGMFHITISIRQSGYSELSKQMKGYPDRISACTTTYFDGIIAVIDPENSWVARWQRTCTPAPWPLLSHLN